MLKYIGHADNIETFRFIEGGYVDAITLDAQLPHFFYTGRPQVEADCLEPPFLRCEKQRTVAETDVQPRAAFGIASHALNHSGRYIALLLERPAGFLVFMRVRENDCRHLWRKMAVCEYVCAIVAAHPRHDRCDNR